MAARGAFEEHGEHIPVAAPRPRAHTTAAPSRPVGSAGEAGLTLVTVIALVAALGGAIGSRVDATIAGALLGGFVGVVAGFAAIYRRYRDL